MGNLREFSPLNTDPAVLEIGTLEVQASGGDEKC
jgi:hypothetical protein